MERDNIRNTHTQVLWEKGFRGETLLVLVTKYGQKRHPKDSCYIILDCSLDCYISKEIAMQLYTQFLPFKRTRDRTLNMRTRAYQGDSYTLNTYQTNFIHSWTVLQIQLIYHYNK